MYTLDDIKNVDMEIADAITSEFDRQNSHIELIASENWVSPAVMSAMGSILTKDIRHIDIMAAVTALMLLKSWQEIVRKNYSDVSM